ncbi:MAG TPA: hypothetical protein VI728_09945, partial [Syntrophales bacterium]|nr:hypothetical protein [Syntrophales bacterium]
KKQNNNAKLLPVISFHKKTLPKKYYFAVSVNLRDSGGILTLTKNKFNRILMLFFCRICEVKFTEKETCL